MCLEEVHTFPGTALATDPDGKFILIKLNDKRVQLFAIGDDKPLGDPFEPLPLLDADGKAFREPFLRGAVLRDGKTVLVYGAKYAQVWDARAAKPLGKPIRHASEGPVALSPNGKLVASGGLDGVVKVWNAETGEMQPKTFQHTGRLYDLVFTNESEHLLTGCGRLPDAPPNSPRVGCVRSALPVSHRRKRIWSRGNKTNGRCP